MQAIAVTHLVDAYRVQEMHQRAEEERRIRHFLAEPGESAPGPGSLVKRIRTMRLALSQHSTTGNVIRGGAAARPPRRVGRGAS